MKFLLLIKLAPLIEQVADPRLRAELVPAAAELRKTIRVAQQAALVSPTFG